MGAGATRVLRAIADAPGAVTLDDLAQVTGLHVNTLRTHLATLLAAGRISRSPVRAGGRGRPRWGYAVRPGEHAALARALVAGLVGLGEGQAEQAALRGGRIWGRQVVDDLGAGELAPRERARAVLAHTGFAPEDGTAGPDRPGADPPLRLTRCPIIDAAREHPEVVCRVHQGMLEGAMEEAPGAPGAPDAPDAPGVALRPFAEPGACWVVLGQPGFGAPGRA